MASSAVFIVTSILLLTGCLCRQLYRKKKRLIVSLPPVVTYKKQVHLYDEAVKLPPPKQKLPLIMKPNESYHSR